jgi:hypothetical protein
MQYFYLPKNLFTCPNSNEFTIEKSFQNIQAKHINALELMNNPKMNANDPSGFNVKYCEHF